MAETLTSNGTGIDTKQLLAALRAVRKGDFTARLPLAYTGVAGEVAEAFNDVIEYLDGSTAELERVGREVGREGKISERASLPGATGGWARRIESVNSLIDDLLQPTLDVSRVIGAVAHGDLSQRMDTEIEGTPRQGEFLRISKTVNTMVDQLGSFASEVTRVTREVGSEGKLGGQAQLEGVAGTWKDLTDNLNLMVRNVTVQVRETKEVTAAVARGDLSKRYTSDACGEFLEVKNVLNGKVDMLNSVASELVRVAREVGLDGKLGGEAVVPDVSGIWKDLTGYLNLMVRNVTVQVRETKEVTAAVARGDLSKRYTGEARGEFLEMKQVLNSKVDMLSSVASELTRLAREVGLEGKLGGQAVVPDVAGIWKELTDSVNMVAGNLTLQLRDVSKVATAIARGDLSQKITVDVKGEILDVKNTINTTVDQLNSFASEVTRVAREVGTEGRLDVQANVEGVAGTWRDLTDSVNSMAGNLTVQLRDVSKVATSIAKGDLTQKITVDVKGEILQIKDTINTMVDQLGSFASEVTRVAREVGTEGKLGGQAVVPGVAGTWKDLTDNVNAMAGNLTVQLRDVSKVATSIAKGDLTQKITVDVKGEILQIKDTINTMVDQLGSFASEVTRVAREVGSEGKLGVQAEVKGVAGTWKDLTDNVNAMAGNLTVQLRDVSKVATAIAEGDLSKKITVDVKGEILQIKDTINTMVDQLNSFASEVTRVAREVGTEGKLGVQAAVPGVAGTWKDLTDNFNAMAANLTVQLRDVSKVATSIARGDLGQKITVDVKGEILQIKETINTMVDQLNSFASEVTRVAREVGTEGRLGVQAVVPGVAGTWKDLTDNVNALSGNLTVQLRDVSKVATAIARGDLGQKITVEVKGEILQIKDTINTMVDQLNSFASEVTRVAREVGTDGKLGGQADVRGVAGTWKDLTDNVNAMAGNLTVQLRDVSKVATAIARGDLGQKITVDVRGEILQIKDAINTMVDQLNSFASEVTRVAREVGTEGKLGVQAIVPGVAGTWKDLTDNVNAMAGNLTVQLRDVSKVATAIAKGDLTQKITVDVRGEILQIKDTINTMVDQLNSFASEVTRVAREVGTDGKLGGQAVVRGVAGTWKDLTDNVNMMGANLTDQVRGIARVVSAIATGDLKRKLTVEAKGEIAELADTINNMIDTLATFAEQVTTVAREVGVEGKLGGQARVPGAAGTWKDLTDNVNQLAANLSTQVRAIAEVATAVTKGDLTRSIRVEALGEVASLKDNINEMIGNLRDTTQKSTEQDWLKTNLAKFTRMLQGQKDLLAVAKLILSELAGVVNAQHGVFYMAEGTDGDSTLKLLSSYAYKERKHLSNQFRPGEGLVGQAALEKERILLTEVPDDYVKISSGLGEGTPMNVVVLPVLFEGAVRAVFELASFNRFSDIHLTFLDQLTESIGIVLNTIAATMRTEELLKQSQSLAEELQSQQEELKETNTRLEQQAKNLRQSEDLLKNQQQQLQATNEELEEKAQQLGLQKTEVERKNTEIEQAKLSLQERAEQLALTSKYKSEFLANMSHELRTPLNSLLILSKMLSDDQGGTLSDKQVEFARTIHASGSDLLSLINDILDMAKIESGTMAVDLSDVPFKDLRDYVDRSFRPVAENKGLQFGIELADTLPQSVGTDSKRLQQVIRNLLSNSFKFTERGSVILQIAPATSGWRADHEILNHADGVIAFSVTDTGIGVPADKLKIIFEPFQQAEGGTSRKYGGTGLGLSISREIARLLGGDIRVTSNEGQGSSFTLYLPQSYQAPPTRPHQTPVEDTYRTKPFHPAPTSVPAASASAQSATRGNSTTARPEAGNFAGTIQRGDRVVLVIEDDAKFANILVDMAEAKGFKGVVAASGEAGIAMAQKLKPDAITLDIQLPDIEGWVVLDRLKHDPETRHIPVHIISVEDHPQRGLKQGAFAYLTKPVSKESLETAFSNIKSFVDRPVKNLLVVEDNAIERNNIVGLIGNNDVHTTAVATGADALEALKSKRFDCLVLDLGLPDMTGFDLIERIHADASLSELPVIVNTARELTEAEEARLKQVADTVVVKDARSPERLLDETALFLHRVEAKLPESKRRMLQQVHESDPVLAGHKVLVVDDDLRNIFAMTSILERQKMLVYRAENGRRGLETLEHVGDIDAVLMDIMMPEMDGYETMRAIRKIERFKSLPIISLTAKAMKGDREKCIEAGASDYIAKPVNADQLLSLLRVWLYR